MQISTAPEVVAAPAAGPDDPQIDRLLELARTYLGMEVAWISRFTGDQQVITAATGLLAGMNVTVGGGTPLSASFCARVVAGALPAVITDARRHPVTRDLSVTQDMNIGSYVGAPWRDADGNIAGMLCCLSRSADPDLDVQAARYMSLLADLVGDHLGSDAARAGQESRQVEAVVRDVLRTHAVRAVVQPVVRLADGVTVAFEALSRFEPATFASPDRAFAAAAVCGLGIDLELLALERALRLRDQLPADMWLGVNLSPEAVSTSAARDLLLPYADRRIGVELTEHTPVGDYDELNAYLRPLRDAGIQLVVDDAGAGFASLNHILQLRPDTIKLDISLVRGVDQDPVRRALARSLAGFAKEVGAALLAEGVETAPERDALLEMGVFYGQGYLWGKPQAPAPL
ncbi:EAL domain-containing protein [Actinoplanes sp. Pm04-4]|uniref:EAL domain-containing protein n=1 Tax=Paractinoplanes pyxinae TaxID=2997416 RepID=A0ABT4AS11_9ACTN|nr:EAL domain-containing protein [Actinoplanes pyxinae]MCY1136617.1 EAL domain-containing protein [Actinoplanes pyxinae]